MKQIWVARVIDGCDFDRVKYEAAFRTAWLAQAWLDAHLAECIENEEPQFKHGWRGEKETLFFYAD